MVLLLLSLNISSLCSACHLPVTDRDAWTIATAPASLSAALYGCVFSAHCERGVMLCGLLWLLWACFLITTLKSFTCLSSLSARAQSKILVVRASGAFTDPRDIGTLLGSSWSRSHAVNGPLTYMLEGLQGSMRSGKQADLQGCWVHIIWHEAWLVNPGVCLFGDCLMLPCIVRPRNSLTALWKSLPTLPSKRGENGVGG